MKHPQAFSLLYFIPLGVQINLKNDHIQFTIRLINLQHVSAGPQPIFGLAGACADWVQPGWNMRGHPAREGAMKYKPRIPYPSSILSQSITDRTINDNR